MNLQKKLLLFIITMTSLSMIVVSIVLIILDRILLQQQEQRLQEVVKSQVLLINAIANNSSLQELTLEERKRQIVEILKTSLQTFQGFANTGEFSLVERRGNQIVFLLNHRDYQFTQPQPVSWNDTQIAQPSRLALQGKTGITIGYDYRGVKVIAAYEAISNLQWGIAIKVDLAQLRAPVIRASIYIFLITISINTLSFYLLYKMSYPVINRLELTEIKNQTLYSELQQEIRDRSQMAIALHQEVELMAKIMEMNQVGILVVNTEGKIILANDQAERILGLNKVEISQRYYNDPSWRISDYSGNLVPEDELAFKQVLTNKKSLYGVKNCLNLPDGDLVFVSLNAAPIFYDNGDIKSVVYSLEDVTNRVSIEKSLYKSEAQFRAIFENSGLGIALIDIHGKFIKTNSAIETMLGYSATELQNIAITDLSYLDDISNDLAILNAIAADKCSFYQLEKRFLHQNRQIIWAKETISVVRNQENEILFLIYILEDINQQKQAEIAVKESEERYRGMIETANEGVWIIDIDGKTTFVNQRMAQILGYTTQEMLGRTIFEFTDAEGRNLGEINMERRRQGIAEQHDFKFLHHNGAEVWVLIATNPIHDAKGNFIGALGLVTDITERKQMEQRLQHTNQQLQQSIAKLELKNQERDILGKINRFIQVCLTKEEAYTSLSDLLPPLFPGCAGVIFLVKDSGYLVEAIATWGEPISTKTLFRPEQCWALRQSNPYHVLRSQVNLFCQHLESESLPNVTLCEPMIAQGKITGLLYLSSTEPEYLNEGKRELAHTLSENLALNLANLKLRESLKEQSIRDPLTGLFNRRYLQESLEREIIQAERQHSSLGIIMIDLDHFKKFNDTFGHDAGDLVLREVGIFLKTHVRGSDIPCRYGGEELIIVLPDADLENTEKRAQQIRAGIKHLNLRSYSDNLGQITVSIGVACYPDHALTAKLLLKVADQALYLAKEKGRDRVVVAV